MNTGKSIMIGTLAALILCANTINAQTSVKASQPKFGKEARADEYEHRAIALHSKPERAAEAARLHRWSAALRSETDPRAVEALAMSAHMFSYAKMPAEARKTMERAAVRALDIGDVQRAAQAYVEAAFFAELESDRGQVTRLGRKALALSESPLHE
jgi:hypothetical protein